MKSDARLHPTVRMALEALESGDRDAWEALFESEAELFDDGKSRSLGTFSRDALGHERFTSIEDVENDGRDVVGQFHSDRWGDFRTYFRFRLSESGKIKRLDIGQATR
jgi:ketosteroid isomerase-like protein